MATQPIDIIKGALRSIGVLAGGETPDPDTTADAFQMLNDMLDQWSNEKMLIFCVQEVIHELTNGQYIYSVGNGGQLTCNFTGSIAANVLTVSAITSGALSVGQILNNPATANTAITSYGTGNGGNGTAAIGTYYLNLSQVVGSQALSSYVPRFLRVNSGFARITTSGSALDYPIAVYSSEEYELIGLKALNGPWPRVVYYQPSEPLGSITYWPSPNAAAEMHLYVDTVLNQFQTVNDTLYLPQGVNMALRFSLAELLMPEFGKSDQGQMAMVIAQAAHARAWLKRTNMHPSQSAKFDPILNSRRQMDAGWILHGGQLY